MPAAPDERLVDVPCALCGASTDAPHWRIGRVRFVRCHRCGHLYQHPRPAAADLRRRYDADYFDYELENAPRFLELMLKGLADIRFERLTRRMDAGRTLLDIGCATGALLEYWQQRGWRVQGVEICEPAARYGIETRGVPIHIGTLQEADFPPNDFHVVHCSHVIEHLPDPRGALAEFYRILRPGGLLILVTPDAAGLQARLLQSGWRSAIGDHLNLFTTRHLRRLLSEIGLRVIRKRSWGGLAQGLAPMGIKRPLDLLVKICNIGDVTLLTARKPEEGGRKK